MSQSLTDQDMLDLRDKLLAEIGRRLKQNPEKLTSAQLMAAAKDLGKLTAGTQAEVEDTDIDLFALVERLPAVQRKKHLQAERVRLEERLARINVALG